MSTAYGWDPIRVVAGLVLAFALVVVIAIFVFEKSVPDEVNEELAHTDIDAEYVELLEEEDAL